jgi:hypothetical protein
MKGNGRASARIRPMYEKMMAAAAALDKEIRPLEGEDDLPRVELRQARAHTGTVI